MFNFEDALNLMARQTVLCVGDLMLDEFVYGEVARISPEAPAPVLAVTRSELVVGGAGNVARNIAALGARCIFVGVVGDDDAGSMLAAKLRAEPLIESHLVVDRSRPTTRKVRFVSEHHSTHLLRADWELAEPIGRETEEAVLDQALAALPHSASVVLSDYAKGLLTPRVIRALIEAARKLGKPVIVDPKGKDFSIYQGATLITPNRQELAEVSRRTLASEADIASAAGELNRSIASAAVLVTRSEAGMSLVPAQRRAGPHRRLSGQGARRVGRRRHRGGGACRHAGRRFRAGAGDACGQCRRRGGGRQARNRDGLGGGAARAHPSRRLARARGEDVFDWTVLDERLGEWRRQGLRIGFTNGCFDLLHPGHVKLLAKARAACDRLIVGLNSDASVSAPEGGGAADAGSARARRGAGGAGGGRSRGHLRRGHAARADPAGASEGPGKGRRLPARAGRRPRARGSRRRRGDPDRSGARLQHQQDRAQIARFPAGLRCAAASPDGREQELVREFFAGVRAGFFVEVGANRPRQESQTWHLEQLGWSGVLIEPQPHLAA